MWSLVRSVVDSLGEDLGRPAQMLTFLERGATLRVDLSAPGSSIALSSVVAWHEWGERPALHWPRRRPGTLPGWRYAAGRYASCQIHRPELERFGTCEVEADWTCEIQSVEGLAASKSELTHFGSLDAMVLANSREMINEISNDHLAKSLAHDEIRILHCERTSDHFARHSWDGRVFLVNSGGSHHFAAARYLASRLGHRVTLRGTLRTYGVDAQAVGALLPRLRDVRHAGRSRDKQCISRRDASPQGQLSLAWAAASLPRCSRGPAAEGRGAFGPDSLVAAFGGPDGSWRPSGADRC